MERIEYLNVTQEDVDQMLESTSFCSLAWVHIHQAPDAKIAPCCIAHFSAEPHVADTVDELVNSEYMRDIRRNMIAGIKNEACNNCYSHERDFGDSFRKGKNSEYGHLMLDALNNTRTDGTVENFKMRYFDIRFSNVCNMKCRSCGPAFSSLWDNEIKLHDVTSNYATPHSGFTPADGNLLQDVLDNHVQHIENAYFAGGEPLVSDEHYAILNKLIELEKFDTALNYNTNASILKFKDYDLVGMWDKFTEGVDIAASIDHVGARAEYIRSGTKWDKVFNNLITLSKMENITLSINTVASALNYVTLDEHVKTIVEAGIIKPDTASHIGFYPLYGPAHLNAQNLPREIKEIGTARNRALIEWLLEQGFLPDNGTITTLQDIITFAEKTDSWAEQRTNFIDNITYFDNIRKENFQTVFPELASMIDD